MFMNVLTNWFRLKSGQPGRRFRDFYRHRQMQRGYRVTFAKAATILCGLVITGIGAVMVPAPGPGSGLFILGLALLGSEFEPIAHVLDWIELKIRPVVMPVKKRLDKMNAPARVSVEIAVGLLTVALGYGLYMLIF